MEEFECVRENEQKLWVKTPPVTHNVWGFFIKDIFPEFSMPEPTFYNLKKSNFLLGDSAKRWGNPDHKYLIREQNPDGGYKSCIADGERFRWTHADLPDDKRGELKVHDWGLVYIPNLAQVGYLDSIAEDLTKKAGERTELLSQINQRERETMKGLLLKLKGALEEKPKTSDELRKKVIGFYGGYNWMLANYQTREILGVGKLPLTSQNPINTIEGQTELDFYRNLDWHLDKRPLNWEKLGYCIDSIYRHLMPEWIISTQLNNARPWW